MGKRRAAAAVIITAVTWTLAFSISVKAQEVVDVQDVQQDLEDSLLPVDSLIIPEGFKMVDSLVYVPASRYTESLAGRNIFHIMPYGVRLNQSPELYAASRRYIAENEQNTLESEGYRIRIYFDNRQDAREASERAQKRFEKLFPGYQTYRSYIYPNFKVTVGDFRSKTDAQIALKEISRYFPSAFIVKERMKFPQISLTELYRVDTISFLVPVNDTEEFDDKWLSKD
ncbi:MAG: SPOR domain-containing protein [Candidatus Cryptobacteroides sp.]